MIARLLVTVKDDATLATSSSHDVVERVDLDRGRGLRVENISCVSSVAAARSCSSLSSSGNAGSRLRPHDRRRLMAVSVALLGFDPGVRVLAT
jgi:hypothetical protein